MPAHQAQQQLHALQREERADQRVQQLQQRLEQRAQRGQLGRSEQRQLERLQTHQDERQQRAQMREQMRQRLMQPEQQTRQDERQQRAQMHEQMRQRLTKPPDQYREERQSRRTARQAPITPKAAAENRFAGRYLHDAQSASRDQWRQARGEHWAARDAWRHGIPAAFVPWYGPVYWPYAYSDIFDYTFWPSSYDESYWAFVYDDFFDGIFFPYGAPYVEDAYSGPYGSYSYNEQYNPNANIYYGTGQPGPPIGTVSSAARQLCEKPDAGVTAWPIDQIAETVQPNDEQRALLDELRTAAAQAADVFRNTCPTAVPMTPISRLQMMTLRLQATLDAMEIVQPALEKFYGSLNDEQRARFDAMQAGVGQQPAQTSADEQANSCSNAKPGLADLPIDRIDQVVQPTDQQEDALARLSGATTDAVAIIQAACPSSTPLTPIGRLEAMKQRISALLTAAKTVQPALEEFYSTLNYEQKARFNTLDRDLARGT